MAYKDWLLEADEEEHMRAEQLKEARFEEAWHERRYHESLLLQLHG